MSARLPTASTNFAAMLRSRGWPYAHCMFGCAGVVGWVPAAGAAIIHDKRMTAFTNTEEAAVGLTSVVPFSLEDKLKEKGADFR